ncbi:MAG: MFS transporter [Bacillota bacterium]
MSPLRPAIWSRDFTLLWLANFLMALSFYFLLPTVPTFATEVLGADKGQVGYLVGLFTVAALATRPLAGYLLDARGRKVTYLGGLLFFALFVFSYQTATAFWLLLAVRFLHGTTWGVISTGGSTVAADLLPPERRGEGLGYYGIAMTLAMALGPMLALALAGDSRYTLVFLAAGGVASLAALMAMAVRYREVPPSGRGFSWDSFVDLRVVPIALIYLITMLTYGGLITFLTLFTAERGLNAGLFFLVYAAVMSLSRPLSGRVQDRLGPTPVLITGFLLLIAGFLVMSLTRTAPLFWVAASLMGVGNGNIWPTLTAMGINLVEPSRRGVASSTLFSAIDLGIGLGSMVMGWVAEAVGLSGMYLVSAGLLVAPLVIYLLYVRPYYQMRVSAHDEPA